MLDFTLHSKPKQKAYMYMIADKHDYIKIGISKEPEKRLKQLQTGHPDDLTLLFTEEFECERKHLLRIEKLVHREISIRNFKKRGEWFNIPADKIESIKNIIIFNRIRYEDDTTYFRQFI